MSGDGDNVDDDERLGFSDRALEESWRVEGMTLNIRMGTRVLLMLNGLWFVHRYQFRPKRCVYEDGEKYVSRIDIWESWLMLEYSFSVGNMIWLGFVYCQPRGEYYYPAVAAFLLNVLIVLHAGEYPCWALADLCSCTEATMDNDRIVLAVLHQDCSLQGVSSVQMILFLTMVSPWLVPERKHMSLYLGAEGVFYFTGICWELYHCRGRQTDITSCLEFHGFGYLFAVVLLYCGVCYFSFVRKYFVEKGQRSKFIAARKQREASQKIFKLLDCMVPEHVIVPMVRNPGETIAEEVPCASIMFVIIEGFDALARGLSPDLVLEFLNHYFSLFDDICSRHRVTKIETVGEEYLCCVGVVPEEQHCEHSDILGRLICVAEEILDQSNVDIQLMAGSGQRDFRLHFKLGLHTGPVVAGVLGQKLPRFRLFGDTINTAARMMQKGEPSQVQFGDATRSRLPSWVRVVPKGQVEMKGKGQMAVYHLDRQPPQDSNLRRVSLGMAPAGDGLDAAASALRLSAARKRSSALDAILDLGNEVRDAAEPEAMPVASQATRRSRASRGRASAGSTPYLPQGTELELGTLQPRDSPPPEQKAAYDPTAREGLLSAPSAAPSPPQSPVPRPDEAPEEVAAAGGKDGKFDEVLNEISSFAAGFGRLGHGFSAEMEEDFRQWFHTTCICKKLRKRLDKQALALCCLTTAEMVITVGRTNGAFEQRHELYGEGLRMPVFVVSRLVAVLIILAWRSAAASSWLQTAAMDVQHRLALSYSLIALLLFCSYDALVGWEGLDARFDDVCKTESIARNAKYHDSLGMIDGSIWGLVFVPMFFLTTTQHPLLFKHSCFFLAAAMFVMVLYDWLGFNNLYLSLPARMTFLGMSIVNLIVVWDMESDARARFRAGRDIALIHERIAIILDTLLPPMVVPELQGSLMQNSVSHKYSDATVVQSDLVGFTKLASSRHPKQVVDFIGELFGLFDDLTDLYEVYKVETVGDAYIACQAGVPLSLRNSPLSVVLFGLDMVRKTKEWAEGKGETVSCRVGVHTGECIGGLVGRDLQRYHLFGELMSEVEVLESTAPEGRVQVSQACEAAVQRQLEGEGLCRGLISFERRSCPQLVTSKGDVHSYAEVGGPTYIVHSSTRFRGWIGI